MRVRQLRRERDQSRDITTRGERRGDGQRQVQHRAAEEAAQEVQKISGGLRGVPDRPDGLLERGLSEVTRGARGRDVGRPAGRVEGGQIEGGTRAKDEVKAGVHLEHALRHDSGAL